MKKNKNNVLIDWNIDEDKLAEMINYTKILKEIGMTTDGRDGIHWVHWIDWLDGQRGFTGMQWEKGDRGIQGVKGDRWEKWEKGDKGIQWIEGKEWVQWPAGMRGIDGEAGIDGKTPTIKITDTHMIVYIDDVQVAKWVLPKSLKWTQWWRGIAGAWIAKGWTVWQILVKRTDAEYDTEWVDWWFEQWIWFENTTYLYIVYWVDENWEVKRWTRDLITEETTGSEQTWTKPISLVEVELLTYN